MSKNYPVYNLNNETIVVLPGTRFTKNELISRLHEMNIDVNNYKDKKEIASLYDSYLMDDTNKFLLINRLRKDTEIFKSKLEISQRQAIFESNANTMSNNSKNKLLNISYDVKPFTEKNSRQQEIIISKPNNLDGSSNYQNTKISHNMNQNQERENYNYNYNDNDNQLRNKYSNNYSNSRIFQDNNQSNNNISYSNNQFNNNYNPSPAGFPTKYENSTNIMNNNMDNKGFNNIGLNVHKKYQNSTDYMNNNIQNNGYNKIDNKQYVEDKNNNNIYFKDNANNQKMFTNIRTPIDNNQMNNNNYKNNNFKNISFNPSQNPYQQDKSQNMIIEEPGQSTLSNEEEQENQENPPSKRGPYDESTLVSLVIVVITIGQIFLIYKYWDSIVDIFTNPGRIINVIFGFVSSLLFGSISNWYIIIPLILLIAVMVVLYQQYVFKNRCKEIIKKIKQHLLNNQNMGENNNLTEDDIYQRFVKNYGISYEEFKRRYIKALRNLRRDVPRLKMIGNSINGKEIMTWYLN